MHTQISKKRREEPSVILGDRFQVFAVDVAGVNSTTLVYEKWTEYAVFERRSDAFGNEYWQDCEVPDWAGLALDRVIAAEPQPA